MKYSPLRMLISLVALLAVPVSAQTPTPPLTPTQQTGAIAGTVVNRTQGRSVPASLDLVLQA